MRIAFNLYGDAGMGMGHVYRCLALAPVLAEAFPGAEVEFVAGEGEPGVSVLREWGEGPVTVIARSAVPDGPFDVLILDRLGCAPDFTARAAAQCRCLVVLDDTGPGRWLADIAVNGLYAARASRPQGAHTLDLSGFSYLMLTPGLASRARPQPERPRRVLITQGGSDTYNLSTPLVTALAPVIATRPELELHLHIGPAHAFAADLDAAINAAPVPVIRHTRLLDMAAFLAGMDLAVAAGGMMACELACLGVPLMLVSGEAKELETMAALAAAGVAMDCGAWSAGNVVAKILIDLLDRPDTLATMSAAGRAALDGRGAERIVAAIAAFLSGGGRSSAG